ncbi:LDH2 family malate/lactate/ureidoglycolate dehydrogenase [Streptomyces griseoviridis]|uniref:LDH2 family malate/lactate/ureidoglycolate dehydrogenase n=1 Tax=Streptomyces griseoviridis TaxID=45398 RepID=A0ABT9LPT5_STRGD|nr:LDH2 family malate/lactate/ureidoglycolate dehydrogenase [Streptomyces griseoviridis]GGS88254.1 hypothetical protein GCM10010240_22120 [Streptomyces griseoviridis]
MATATIALGKIRQARADGTRLPENAAATGDGTPTTDPERAVMPLPLGGAKGSGLSLAFELLTGVLVGAPIFSAFHSADPAGREHGQNALLIALDPAEFGGGAADFTGAVDTTLDTLEGLPAAEDAAGVYCPGERGAAVAANSVGTGAGRPEGLARTRRGRRPLRPHPARPRVTPRARHIAGRTRGREEEGGRPATPPPLRMR